VRLQRFAQHGERQSGGKAWLARVIADGLSPAGELTRYPPQAGTIDSSGKIKRAVALDVQRAMDGRNADVQTEQRIELRLVVSPPAPY
jgi:hypothetical protein